MTPGDWAALVILPAMGMTANHWLNGKRLKMEERHSDHDGRRDEHAQWRGDFDAIRDEWESIREAWGIRLRAAETGERDCEKRCMELQVRVDRMEGELDLCHTALHKHREEIAVLRLEADMRKHLPDENGAPR